PAGGWAWGCRQGAELGGGVGGAEARGDWGGEIDAGRRPRAHAAPAGDDPAEGVDAGRRRLEGLEGAAAPLEEQRTRRGGRRALADALEQGQAQGILELADVEADRGLAQAEGLGRAGGDREP